MVNHFKQRKQWAEGKAHALGLTGCAACGRWGDRPDLAHADEAQMLRPEREPFMVTDDDGNPLSCRLVTTYEIEQYEFWKGMPDYQVWCHELHLGFGVAECNKGCETPGETPKAVGLIAAIKARLKVEDIASRLTDLRGSGNRLRGRCPLHGEQNGESFTVYLDTESWYCFGACARGGDVIELIKELHERGIKWRTNK